MRKSLAHPLSWKLVSMSLTRRRMRSRSLLSRRSSVLRQDDGQCDQEADGYGYDHPHSRPARVTVDVVYRGVVVGMRVAPLSTAGPSKCIAVESLSGRLSTIVCCCTVRRVCAAVWVIRSGILKLVLIADSTGIAGCSAFRSLSRRASPRLNDDGLMVSTIAKSLPAASYSVISFVNLSGGGVRQRRMLHREVCQGS